MSGITSILGIDAGNKQIAANNQQKGKSPQAPAAPDYIGAANAQSEGTIGASIANNMLSHPNVNTPLGSQTWNQTGSQTLNIPGLGDISIPQYAQNINLSPEQQTLYNNQVGMQTGLQGQAANNLSQPSDLSSVQDVANQAYGNLTSRLDPQWAQNEEQQTSQLANQGITQGSDAYNNAMRTFGQQKNDAYQQANLAAINTMPQTFQLGASIRDQPLNELASLQSGSPVQMPQFQASQYSANAQGPNTLGATSAGANWQQQMYNQGVAMQNANTQGMYGLGGAALAAFM